MRDQKVTVCFSQSELSEISEKAAEANMKPSQYIRETSRNSEIIGMKEVNGIARGLCELTLMIQTMINEPEVQNEFLKRSEEIWQCLKLSVSEN